jgi:hypothetical protein
MLRRELSSGGGESKLGSRLVIARTQMKAQDW